MLLFRKNTISLLLAAGLATISSFAYASQPHETSLSGNFLASRSAALSRDNEAAAEYLASALKQDPGNANIIERLFQIRLSTGNLGEAERLAEDVLSFNSQQRMARIVLGLKEFRNRRYEQARQHFSEAAYTPVGELTSALLSAWAYAGEGSLNAAMTELDKLDGNESFANFKSFHAALIADYLGSSIRADAAYKKAYQEAGTSLRVTQAYGDFLKRSKRVADAEKVYRSFLEGGDSNAMIEKALAQLNDGDTSKPFIQDAGAGAGEALFSLTAAMNDDQSIDVALLYAQLALSFNADKPVMLTMLGDILSGTQRYEAAIAAYEKIPASSELRTNADTEIAVNLQRMDKGVDAQARIRGIVTREPNNFEAWVTLGNIHRNNDQFVEAADAYTSALKLVQTPSRNQWSIFYYRGIAFERQKKWAESEADFRKALELSTDEASVLNYLGYSLIDKNMKLDEAIAMVKKAVELKPNDGYIVDSLGWAYFQLRDFEQAVEHLERAVDLKAGDPIIAEHLGDAYWRVGRTLEAKFQWQHAKDNKPEPEDLKRIEDKLKSGMLDLPPLVKPAENGASGTTNG